MKLNLRKYYFVISTHLSIFKHICAPEICASIFICPLVKLDLCIAVTTPVARLVSITGNKYFALANRNVNSPIRKIEASRTLQCRPADCRCSAGKRLSFALCPLELDVQDARIARLAWISDRVVREVWQSDKDHSIRRLMDHKLDPKIGDTLNHI